MGINKNTVKFILLTLLFSACSLLIKNILINNYNGAQFNFITIEHIKNYGAAFSMFQYHTSFLIIISITILILALFYILKNINDIKTSEFVFSSLLTAGIICNLVERLNDGYVTDYLQLNFVSFPIFNISDVFICTGAFMLICNILFNNDNSKDDNKTNN